MVFVSSCGGDDPVVNNEENNETTTVEEFLTIDGTKYSSDKFKFKRFSPEGNTYGQIKVQIEGEYDFLTLELPFKEGTKEIENRKYITGFGSDNSPLFEEFAVGFYFATGPSPQYCQYVGEDVGSPFNVEIKEVDGKQIVEFTNSKVVCGADGGSGPDSHTLCGYWVLEDL